MIPLKPLTAILQACQVVAMLALCLAATSAQAHHESAYYQYEYAKVLSAQPIVAPRQLSEPQTPCWRERPQHHRYAQRSDPASTIIGGILGAAVGNALAHGRSNRGLGAAAGGLLGAAIGYDIGRQDGRSVARVDSNRLPASVRRCETTEQRYAQRRIVGYEVKYRYHGGVYTSRMDHDPGRLLKVRVLVEPAY